MHGSTGRSSRARLFDVSDGVVHRAGEGERHTLGHSSAATLKADAEATGGLFYLSECDVEAGYPGPPPHVHDHIADSFYVLDGTLTVTLGQATIELGPGGFACAPPGVRHTFANRSDARVRFLNINAPGGFERYMRELAAASREGPISSEQIGEIASRFDLRVVD
jgi:mannose-6-phosphate isomerase-like protein (cupin superfamily)